MTAFGHNFVIINKTRQMFTPGIFQGGPWIHVATVVRGFKEYCAFVHQPDNRLFIEEVDPSDPNLFVSITDDAEWADLYRFLMGEGLIVTGSDQEIEIARNIIDG